jgi:hypothetical protein
MALKALLTAARAQSRNVNMTVTATRPDKTLLAQFTVDADNFDVLQIAELPIGTDIELNAAGSGEVRFQLVRRFNVFLADQIIENNMTLQVTYDANHVEVDDIVNVTAVVRYMGPPGSSGMMIVDVGVPTGFAPVSESLDDLAEAGTVSKAEVAGRKVIFYVDGLSSGEQRSFTFQVKARFPVRAVIPDSKAYLYYEPHVRAEASGAGIAVGDVAAAGLPVDHPDYDEWVEVGEPICWSYSRQCHGDADGASEGRQQYWVSTDDLDILIAAWNKTFAEIDGQTVNGVPLICADFDHEAQGTNSYRVSTDDLDILIANWNMANAPAGDCP